MAIPNSLYGQTEVVKANNTTAMATGSSWVGNTVPGTSNTALFDNTLTSSVTSFGTGGIVSVLGVRVTTGSSLINIDNSTVANYFGAYGGGIDMSTASRDLRVTSFQQQADHTWNIATGRTLTIGDSNGSVGFGRFAQANGSVLSLVGGGTISISRATAAISLGDASGFTGSLATNGTTLALVANTAESITFGGTLSGTTTISKSGAGTYELPGANNLGGSVSVSAGTLVLSGTNTFSGNALTKAGAGTLLLNGSNTYTGATTISAGTLQVGDGGTTGTIGTGNIILNAGGTLAINRSNPVSLSNTWDGFNTINSDYTLRNDGTGLLTLTGAGTNLGANVGGTTFVLAGDGDGQIDQSLASGGGAGMGIRKEGSGTWTLTSNSNGYSGATRISAGTLQIGNGGSTGKLGTGNIILNAGGTLAFNRNTDISVSNAWNTLTGGSTQTLRNDGTGLVTIAGSSGNIGGDGTGETLILAGSGDGVIEQSFASGGAALNIQKEGAGTWTLTNAATNYSGTTTITAGTLEITGRLGQGTYAQTISNDGELHINTASAQTLSGAQVLDGTSGNTIDSTNIYSTGSSSSDTLTLSQGFFLDYLLVGGGGGGGGTAWNNGGASVAGGGGAGGQVVTSIGGSQLVLQSSSLSITVGAGGNGGGYGFASSEGGVSQLSGASISTIQALGGGRAGGRGYPPNTYGAMDFGGEVNTGGDGARGVNANSGRLGGSGVSNDITGIPTFYGGGGSAGGRDGGPSALAGGAGGGGAGTNYVGGGSGGNGGLGGANTGGGGGGASATTTTYFTGGAGGSGLAVLRFEGGLDGIDVSGLASSDYTQDMGGSLAGNALIQFKSSHTLSLDLDARLRSIITNSISGSGTFAYDGPGTLVLEANNSYTGNTTITAGTLQIGNGGTSGTLGAGAISNSGVLRFNRSNTITMANGNLLSGNGTVEQSGEGTLDLGGNSHGAGEWVLQAGSISNGTLSSGNFTLENGTLSAVLSGTGNLTKNTPGTVTLSANNDYSGTTNIDAGVLTINGTHSGAGAVSVNAGGTLKGSGSIAGNTTITNNGTMLAGNSIGTLSFTNDLTFESGGNWNWQITNGSNSGTPGTDWDQILVGGSLTITATSADPFHINVWSILGDGANGLLNNFEPKLQAYTWTILTATGGITGFDADDFEIHTEPNNGAGGLITASTVEGFSVLLDGNSLKLQYDPPAAETLDGTNDGTVTSNFTTQNTSGQLTLDLGFFAEYLVVGGGGGGSGTQWENHYAGGGGSGGEVISNLGATPIRLWDESLTVNIGAGGSAGTHNNPAGNGGNTVISGSNLGSIQALGGGRAGNPNYASQLGGGLQNQGGYGVRLLNPGTGRSGGAGISNAITGSAVFYGGGGSAGGRNGDPNAMPGGTGGGGGGTNYVGSGPNGNGGNGVANTGGGGGGASATTVTYFSGGSGGSGVAVLRYQGPSVLDGTAANGTGTASGYTVHTFTSSGNFDLSAVDFNDRLKATLSGNIVGNGKLIYDSEGRLTLTGSAHTYSGATEIKNGELRVNSDISSSSGVTVDAGATLSGTGTLPSSVINGVHAPGSSPGLQTVSGDLTYGAGSTLNWELITNSIGARGTDYDGIDVSGNLDFSGAMSLSLDFDAAGSGVDWTQGFWADGHRGASGWKVFQVSGSVSGLDNVSVVLGDSLDSQGQKLGGVRSPATRFSLSVLSVEGAQHVYLNYTSNAVVATDSVGSVLGATATAYGRLVSLGDSAVVEHGHCWSSSPSPERGGEGVECTQLGRLTAPGAMVSPMTGLSVSTLYYVRSYAANDLGTFYGEQVSFTTGTPASLSTDGVDRVGSRVARVAASVSDAGSGVSERGVEVSASADFAGAVRLMDATAGAGSYALAASGLSASTRYYARAYATGPGGQAYGDTLVFKTGVSGVEVSGQAGFRLVSSPVSGAVVGDLLEAFWTQGMAGADASTGAANVWSFDGSQWQELSDISATGYELDAGRGLLVYVFEDADNDGQGGDLASGLVMSASGAGPENVGDVVVSSLAYSSDATGAASGQGWNLVGNPFSHALVADALSLGGVDGVNDAFTSSVYVYDHAYSGGESGDSAAQPSGGWRTWNGTVGSLAGGLISPYQGFFVQSTSASASSLSIPESAKDTLASVFYKSPARPTSSVASSASAVTGSASSATGATSSSAAWLSLIVEGEGLGQASTHLSLRPDGAYGLDAGDAWKLVPMQAATRVVAMSFDQNGALDIQNLPIQGSQNLRIPVELAAVAPLEALLSPQESVQGGYERLSRALRVSWSSGGLDQAGVELVLVDRVTGSQLELNEPGQYEFTSQSGGLIPATGGLSYPRLSNTRFELVVRYSGVTTSLERTLGQELPRQVALSQNYPNPFNPSTQIRFGLPQASQGVSLAVYDALGRRVASLLDGASLGAGWYELTFEASHLPSGNYIYRLHTPHATLTRSLSLIK